MELLQSADAKLILYGIIGLLVLFIILKLFKWPLKILLNGVFGVFLLYLVNLIGANFDFSIGINIVTALIAGILGIPGAAALIIFKLFMWKLKMRIEHIIGINFNLMPIFFCKF